MRHPFSPSLSRRRVLGGAMALGAGLAGLPRLARSAAENTVNVYNWRDYIGETTLASFTATTGIELRYDEFANNETLLASLANGRGDYDVVFPSDYMVEAMIARDMLAPLDHARIPNIRHIDPDANFSNPAYNPGLAHGVPYLWGTMGIGYRRSRLGRAPDSWSWILDPEKSEPFAGRNAWIADGRTMTGFALKYLGYSLNSIDTSEISAARNLLIAAKGNVKTLAPDSGQQLLLAGEVDLAIEWNGDIAEVQREDGDIGYVVPREGSMIWTDNMCIPADAPHPGPAHAFINHLLDPEVNAEIANFLRTATANAAAREMVDPGDLNDPAIYAPPAVVAKSESLLDIGEFQQLYDAAWNRVLAA